MRVPAMCLVLSVMLLCLSACGARQSSVPMPEVPDLVIANGLVVDGTGGKARRADVVIHGDRIVRVGRVPDGVRPARVIDAAGRVVAPGFIDTHAHGEPAETPGFPNFTAQGVTSICLGMDGASANAADMADWMMRAEAARPAVNIVPFVGHGTVRKESGTAYSSDPTPEQIAAMEALVRTAMEAGCWGMTTGIEYHPGIFATRAELAATARPVAEHGGLVMSHMRSEDDDAVEAAIDELLTQGADAGCAVHVSHFKVVYGKGPGRAEELLGRLEDARRRGIRVTADVYPYTASYTGIGIVFPEWAKPPHDWSEVKRTRRAELQEYLRRRVALRNGPGATLFGTEPWTGMTLEQVAEELGMPFEDVLIDRIGPFGGGAAYFVMDEPLQARLLADPHVMVCSDGSPGMHHPRGYGSFAKIVAHYVVGTEMLGLEEAVHKMTGLPAATVGLDQGEDPRGLLREGFMADVVVFDPKAVRDTATFDQPHQLAEGFDTVLVNGVLVRGSGEETGERGGRLLRKR